MLEKIPTDKNGKPLKTGQGVEAEFNGVGPPRLLFGRIMYVGSEKSFVMPDGGKGDTVDNSKIEIKID
jgi:hypothetical protein